MKFKIIMMLCVVTGFVGHSQEKPKRVDERIDELTLTWDSVSVKLENYEGLKQMCKNKPYRVKVFDLLNEIHHYDSVLLEILKKLKIKDPSNKEIKKSIKDVQKLEKNFSAKKFVHFMHEECKEVTEIEGEAPENFNGVGENSYSGQVYILETQLYKYVKHTTHQIDKIREHVHHLSKHYNE